MSQPKSTRSPVLVTRYIGPLVGECCLIDFKQYTPHDAPAICKWGIDINSGTWLEFAGRYDLSLIMKILHSIAEVVKHHDDKST